LPTRISLLGKLRNCDDHEGWSRFFETYWRLIYSFAMRAGLSDQEAQEVVQETVISVAGTMPKFKYDPAVCSFKGWLRHLAERRIVDQIRKRPRVLLANDLKQAETSVADVIESAPDPAGNELEAIWQTEWEQNLRAAALEKLQAQVKTKHYQIYVLHVIQGKPVAEVSKLLGSNIATVYVVKHRLSRLLREIVRKLEQNPV